jgi:hypothetical protein
VIHVFGAARRHSVPLKSLSISAIAFGTIAFVQLAVAATPEEACGLPEDLRTEIAAEYSGRRIVTISDLDEDDKKFFRADHGDTCPGMISVDFYGDGKPAMGMVLIAGKGVKAKANLVVAHKVGGSWKTTLLDTGGDGPIPVVWSQPPGKYRDVYGKKDIRAARPVLTTSRRQLLRLDGKGRRQGLDLRLM